jgi:1,4-dihydroxy-2-naphthoyl-CoA hydrolase
MPFIHQRTVRFRDTDAAGVVYFATVLAICHEAYEESLMAAGLDLKVFFQSPKVAIPIVHADVDFFRPLHCGDRLLIQLTPHAISNHEFEIFYQICLTEQDRPICKASTRHVCIQVAERSRQDLPVELCQWLERFA